MKWLVKALGTIVTFTLVFILLYITSLPIGLAAQAALMVLTMAMLFFSQMLLWRIFPKLAPDETWISFQTGSVVPATGRAWYAGLVEFTSGLGQFVIGFAVMLFAIVFFMTTGSNTILLYYGIPAILAMLAFDAFGTLAMPRCRHCGNRLQSRNMPKNREVWDVCYTCRLRESTGLYDIGG